MCDILRLDAGDPDLSEWEILVDRIESTSTASVRIGIIGKYVSLQDAYLSVAEALKHGGFHHGCQRRDRVDPGRGGRGAARRRPAPRARRHRDPRRVRRAGHRGQDHGGRLRPRARHPVPRPVPRAADDDDRVRPQRARPGRRQLERARPHHAAPGDRPHGDPARRHRHGRHDAPRRLRRPAAPRARRSPRPTAPPSCPSATATATSSTRSYRARFDESDLWCSGTSPDGRLVEFIELRGHPFWVGTQAHPELKSRPTRPAPLFRELVGAALGPGRGPQAAPLRPRRRPARSSISRVTAAASPSSARTSSSRPRRSGVVRSRFRGARRRRVRARHRPPPRRGGGRAAARRRHGHASSASTGPPSTHELLEIPAGTRDVDGEPDERHRRARAGRGGRPGRRRRSSTSSPSTTRRASPTRRSRVFLAPRPHARCRTTARASRSTP